MVRHLEPPTRSPQAQTFNRISQPHGYTIDAPVAMPTPTLILVGDWDPFYTVEEGTICYRALPNGEISVLPNTGHLIDTPAVHATAVHRAPV